MNFEGKRRPPLGRSSFHQVANGKYYYVDKSQFIARILDDCDDGGVMLFTRPRRFGKSLVLDMVRTFFTSDDAQTNSQLFKGLQIEQAGSRYMAEQGQYPIISINFGSTHPGNYEEFRRDLANVLSLVCTRFYYLTQGDVLSDVEKTRLTKWCTCGTPLEDYKQMLSTLSHWLQRAHPQKHPVIVLIDEYDTPLQTAHTEGYYQQAVNFFRDFLNDGLKDNSSLKFAMLTGILRVTKESIFSGLNNLVVDTVFNTKYPDLFGFTQDDVNAIAAEYECQDRLDDLKLWYDGYEFGTDNNKKPNYRPVSIYNPWSILSFIYDEGILGYKWVNTSSNTLVLQMCETLSDSGYKLLVRLMNGDTVNIVLKDTVTYGSIEGDDAAVITFLTMAGYFNATCIENYSGTKIYAVRMPNKEVSLVYQDEIVKNWQMRFRSRSLEDMLQALVDGNSIEFQEQMEEFIGKACSYYNGSRTSERGKKDAEHWNRCAEDFYHGLMLGMTGGLTRYYTVESEKESGWGRADIMFIPRANVRCPRTLPVIVLELKRARKPADLATLATKALEQIRELHYGEKEADGRQLLRYGIAFYRNQAKVVAG